MARRAAVGRPHQELKVATHAPIPADPVPGVPRFRERPTHWLAPDAYAFATPPLLGAAAAVVFGWMAVAAACAAAAATVAAFFRNPKREMVVEIAGLAAGSAEDLASSPDLALAPADGRVIEVVPESLSDGRQGLRIAIFLSPLDVHVNRSPVAGRVLSLRRSGAGFAPAYRVDRARNNAQLAAELELADGRRVTVTQIAGVLARRIVCHLAVGEWVERGCRYGLIRFGSRTDVLLPPGSRALVTPGERVRGGRSPLALLGAAAGGAP